MVTLQTADNALKTFYLDAVTQEIDSKISPFLSMIEKTSAYVNGKGVARLVRTGYKGSVGAGTETGNLPQARANEYITLKTDLKNLYGTIEISDKALRATANNEGAFVNILNDEIQALVQSAKENFSRMLFGNGHGNIGKILAHDDKSFTLDNVAGAYPGMILDLYIYGEYYTGGYIVKEVDKKAKKLIIENYWEMTSDDKTQMDLVCRDNALDCELTGFGAIFSDKEIYGLPRTQPLLKPYMETDVGEISEEVMQRAIDEVESASGGKVNMIICSRGVRRALIAYYRANKIILSTTTLGDDPTVMTFNGIPVVVDDYCPDGTMYFLNTNDFKLCQLCDWQWMEGESGKILKQIPGTPVYRATLVKYAELLCEKPSGQGMLSGITEA